TAIALEGRGACTCSPTIVVPPSPARRPPLTTFIPYTTLFRAYDGGASANILTETLNDVIGLDDVSLTGGTADYSDKNVANGKTVYRKGTRLPSSHVGNFYATRGATNTAENTGNPVERNVHAGL